MTFTLAADGRSDRVLLPIIEWSLRNCGATSFAGAWADFGRIPRQRDNEARWRIAVDLYPCDILFVHRDAEAQNPAERRREISTALATAGITWVPVIPVRMTEAWLLANERAIRMAAGNPHGTEPLGLPNLNRLEDLPDPKLILHDALKRACGLNARRRARFNATQCAHLITSHIEDYSPLQALPAFRHLQDDIRNVLARLPNL